LTRDHIYLTPPRIHASHGYSDAIRDAMNFALRTMSSIPDVMNLACRTTNSIRGHIYENKNAFFVGSL
jgi:hypothetical protein